MSGWDDMTVLTPAEPRATDFDLRGKDYLSEREAAHYACVSVSQFRDRREEYGIMPIRFMGKLVYRKTDIQRAIEDAWRRFQPGASTESSRGRTRRERDTATALAE